MIELLLDKLSWLSEYEANDETSLKTRGYILQNYYPLYCFKQLDISINQASLLTFFMAHS
jgi:hypothetical protein